MLEVDDSRFPLLVMSFSGSFGTNEVAGFEAEMEKQIARQLPYGILISSTKLPMPELNVIRRLGDWTRDNSDDVARYALCTGIHLPSALLRGAISFLNSISPPPSPQRVFRDIDAAEAWVIEHLAGAGVSVPSR